MIGAQSDLAEADDRWFTFAAGVGFDAAIIARVDRLRARGRKSSVLLFARAGLREFWASDRRHPQLSLELEPPLGQAAQARTRPSDPATRRSTDLYYVVVANCDPWTYIGGRALHPTPQASFDTGLDVFARTRMGAPGVLAAMAHIARPNPKPVRFGSVVRHDLSDFTLTAAGADAAAVRRRADRGTRSRPLPGSKQRP